MTAAQATARLLALVNRERTQRGLRPVDARKDVGSIAMRWSVTMARRGELSHNDAYFSHENRRSLDARALGENVARAVDVESAHRALMASDHHRANILDERFTVAGFGAELDHGSWWFTQDFLQPVARSAARTAPTSSSLRERGARGGPASDVRAAAGPAVVRTPVTSPSTESVTDGGVRRFRIERTNGAQRERPDRSRSDQHQEAAVALLAAVVVGALALRRSAVQRVLQAKRAWRPVTALDAPAEPTVEEDDSAGGGRKHLAIISSWTRTLEDRWSTMSASDKRIAIQAIGRSAEEALADMAAV